MIAQERVFIRHPADIPIEVSATQKAVLSCQLNDVGGGGLSFQTNRPWLSGHIIHIRIPCTKPPFDIDAHVVWCRPRTGGYEVGVCFDTPGDQFKIRMVEQVCHIEQYRQKMAALGRHLSSEEAAAEWIKQYAGAFPGTGKPSDQT